VHAPQLLQQWTHGLFPPAYHFTDEVDRITDHFTDEVIRAAANFNRVVRRRLEGVTEQETRGATGPSADAEPRWLTPDEEEAWKAVAAIFVLLPAALDAQLQRDADLNVFEYFVLSALSTAEDRTLRMSDLAEIANGSLSRLSNAVKRFERRGWVRREPDPADGRYTNAILTDAGWTVVENAAPGHVDAVRRFVLDPLTQAQIRSLRAIGTRIVRQVSPKTRLDR
jgi:DNA-binding MarR family transcriptional regulator